MATIFRKFLGWAWAPLIVTSVVGCVGKTSINSTHPLIAAGTAEQSARVYFIRPDPGFRGVMDKPVTISIGGTKLLKLSKGQYTLLPLASGTFETKIKSFTVGESGSMTPVSTMGELTLSPRRTYYFLFELAPRRFEVRGGWRFFPIGVSRERAFEVARKLTPVGLAINEPILQR